ncbi:hypothetical protein CDAR_315261 [Caerostris darwini]|uniref:Uncharacterized protein n=1 Tax=Caerostris darwini TaxID=1538125 RepID=A0AAV4WAE2_9ARAC|nr:hypothetical protein CDAR_315261 [Caerostris darwini]
MTKRFQTETLGSDFLQRRADIYGTCANPFDVNHAFQLPPGDTIFHPLPPPHKTSSSSSQFSYQHHSDLYSLPVRNQSVFSCPIMDTFPTLVISFYLGSQSASFSIL